MAALSLTLLLSAGVFVDSRSSADANSEGGTLVSYFNQYRQSHGIAALSANSTMMSNAQDQAQKNVTACQFGTTYPGHSKPAGMNSVTGWNTYGYNTAAEVWNVYKDDSQMQGIIGDSYYNSVGIGMAYNGSCQWGNIWVIDMANIAGGSTNPPTSTPSHTPTHTPSPTSTPTSTPGHTPIPTPTPATTTPTPTPTASPGPSDTVHPTLPDKGTPPPTESPGNSATPTSDVSQSPIDATPTPIVDPTTPALMPGDVDCDGTINMGDVLLLLKVIAHVPTLAACLGLAGVDCTGGVDAADALVLLEFIEGIPYHLADGCPSLGSPTPAPTPQETPTPTPTATLETKTPTPAITPVPLGINHCEFAMIAYHLDTNESLDGFDRCTPGAGTAYDCDFNTNGHKAACLSSSSDFPNYSCSFVDSNFGDCVPDAGAPEYQCFDNGAHMVECMPTHTAYAWYDCAVNGEDVTCTSVAPTPDFACRHDGAEFSCLALAPAIPTASPG